MRPVRLSALLTAALPLWLPTVAKAQQTPPPIPTQLPPWQGWHGHMWGDGMGWPMFWGGPFMMILVVFAFIWATRLLFGHARWRDEFHHGGRHGGDGDPSRSALRILNDRFARGEIQKDEYEDRKAALLGEARS